MMGARSYLLSLGKAYTIAALMHFFGMSDVRMSEEFKWGFFSNWKGGEGNNVEDDLIQEIFNKISKGAVQRMGANKTIDAISKICQATGGGITQN